MSSSDRALALQLDAALLRFHREVRPLPGILPPTRRGSLVGQLVESVRRIRYVSVISRLKLSSLRKDPTSDLFDPIRGAILCKRLGAIDEAFWFVFLSVHFGKNLRTGWRLARDIYGALNGAIRWDWERTSSNPARFREWLAAHETILGNDGISRGFGNHRKYQSLSARSETGTGAAVETYVRWVGPSRSHEMLVRDALTAAGPHPRLVFDYLYRSMNAVASFGRTARFDYLTMIGKLGLAPIEPGSTYMQGATGPLAGARLLFDKDEGRNTADAWLIELEGYLHVGMQVMEDALCNWQKSPDRFKPFRG